MKKSHDFLVTIKDGGFNFGSDFNRGRFVDWSRKNKGQRAGISLLVPESIDQRGFFEGGVCRLVAFFQEGMIHTNNKDVKTVREWLKVHFNGEYVVIAGKSEKMGGSTKNELNNGFLDRVIDWIEEEYGVDRSQVLDPKEYDMWKDTIFPYGGPDNFIDYLVSIGRLQIPKEKL